MNPGDAIGDWIVVRTLGRGGMGTVFLCHHRSDPDDLAALKIFPAWSTDADGFKRFEREIDVLTRLHHPGIVPLKRSRTAQGRDTASGVYWIAMELVDGPSLETRLDEGPLPFGFAAAQFRVLADALSYAHSQGVFHRDIKPANIVLGKDGVRLVDFGIALQRERTRLTAVGTFAGTLAYMPPEVVVDERVHPNPMMGDIYALGVVLYEAITAERAFQTDRGLSDRARQMRILKAKMQSDVLDPGPDVPEALRIAVSETTEPDPAKRLSHWGRFMDLMDAVAAEDDSVGAAVTGEGDEASDATQHAQGPATEQLRRPVTRPARGRLVSPRSAAHTPTPPPVSRPLPTPPRPPEEPTEQAAWVAGEGDDSGFTDVRPPLPAAVEEEDDADTPTATEATSPGYGQEPVLADDEVTDAVPLAAAKTVAAERPSLASAAPAAKPAPSPSPRPSPVVSAPAPAPAAAQVVATPRAPVEEDEAEGVPLLLWLLGGGAVALFALAAFIVVWVGQGMPGAQPPGAAPAVAEAQPAAEAPVAAAQDAPADDAVADAVDGGAAPGGISWSDTGIDKPPLPWKAGSQSAAVGDGRSRAVAAVGSNRDKRTIKRQVKFTADGPAAQVYLNGRRRGSTPLTLVLDAGSYELRFVGPERTLTEPVTIGKFSADEYVFLEGRREIKPRFN